MIELDGQSLSISDVARIARDDAPVGLTPAPALAPLYSAIRDTVPTMVGDRVVGADIDAVQQVLARSGEVLLN